MPDLTDRQMRALHLRAAFDGKDFDRFHKGIRDASAALTSILNAHPNERGELGNALHKFVAEGFVCDSEDYEDGQVRVIDDVADVLAGDRYVINSLIEELTPPAEPIPEQLLAEIDERAPFCRTGCDASLHAREMTAEIRALRTAYEHLRERLRVAEETALRR